MDPFITKQVLSLTTAVLTQIILTADITTIPAAKNHHHHKYEPND